MGYLHIVGGIKKLNNKNYNTWATCMESYLQGQDLWDVVRGNDWKIKVVALKITIEEEMLENKRKAKTSNEAWDPFATLFSRRSRIS
ncbi:hypothetical protein PRUPE_2G033500 [Prunus persica]|uniref:DUF4219 domain-containing protein n=1 Tax=Prunus persica TaxID=3760 RepID=A0A251QAF0_PRUPE|nr:hypothetical protein PRUPE_2G033500 [Prunus persica]